MIKTLLFLITQKETRKFLVSSHEALKLLITLSHFSFKPQSLNDGYPKPKAT